MATDLHVVQRYNISAADVFAALADQEFITGRLQSAGGIDPTVNELTATGDGTDRTVTIATSQALPASVLPSMVSAMLPGDPVIVRTENWRVDGDTYVADLNVVVKNAPASLKGTMTLAADGAGCTNTIAAQASVPIPMFGGKIETVIVEQVTKLLTAEEAYTATTLSA